MTERGPQRPTRRANGANGSAIDRIRPQNGRLVLYGRERLQPILQREFGVALREQQFGNGLGRGFPVRLVNGQRQSGNLSPPRKPTALLEVAWDAAVVIGCFVAYPIDVILATSFVRV